MVFTLSQITNLRYGLCISEIDLSLYLKLMVTFAHAMLNQNIFVFKIKVYLTLHRRKNTFYFW